MGQDTKAAPVVAVLAVMDACADNLADAQRSMCAAQLTEARAAVAELVLAAAKVVRYADSEPDGGTMVEMHRANVERCRAALVAMGADL